MALLRNCLLVGAVVFLASLFGIMTRPVGFLASFWPANALLLGLFIRFPHLATPAGWATATAAYLAADFVTGGDVLTTFWLTGANLAGVMAGLLAARFLSAEDRSLQNGGSMLNMFGVCLVSAIAAAVVGSGAANVVYERDFATGAYVWFTTEFVNAAIIVPIVVTMPGLGEFRGWLTNERPSRSVIPFLFTIVSIGIGHVVGGPGMIAFSVPGLLWCALSYNLFTTALITAAVCSWQLIAVALGAIAVPMGEDVLLSTISIRLGVACVALGPLTVAAINIARNRLLENLDRSANYDSLTGALSRAAFMSRATVVIRKSVIDETAPAVLMFDLDHFKSINDRYGHAAGDRTLRLFASAVHDMVRDSDLFGRVGGEEFALVLPRTLRSEALMVAERIREKIAVDPFDLGSDVLLPVTVSIGVAYGGTDLEQMLSEADAALYRAKAEGRNRVAEASSAVPADRRRNEPESAVQAA